MDIAVLEAILGAQSPLTIDTISHQSGLSVAQVRRELDLLRDAGCVFDEHPQRGIQLVEAGLGCWASWIEPRHAGRLGQTLHVYRETSSTQDAARQVLKTGTHIVSRSKKLFASPFSGIVVAADHQTAGRGRLGRGWVARRGTALLLTVIADVGSMTVDRLMLASCCAVAWTIEAAGVAAAQVRWPNDVLIDGRKIAGILIESVASPAVALIGIGLNVSTGKEGLPPGVAATSLALEGIQSDRLMVLDTLLDRLHAALYNTDDADLRSHWARRSCLNGQRITVDAAGRTVTGRVIDLDPQHGLLLADDRGAVHTLPAATTSLI